MSLQDKYHHGAVQADGTLKFVERTAETGLQVRVSSRGDEAWVDWEMGDVAMLNGTFLSSRAVFGLFPLAFSPDGSVLAVYHADDAHAGRRILTLYDVATRQAIDTAPLRQDSTDGIAFVTNEWDAVMFNDEMTRRMPNGELWATPFDTEHFTFGGFGRDPDYPASISRYDHRTGETKRWLGKTQVPVFALEHGGQDYCFISGTEDAPAPENVVWSDDFPALPPVPVPELPASIIPPQRATWIVDSEGILTPRGNGISTSDGPGPKYFEDAAWVKKTGLDESKLECLYFGPELPHPNGETEQQYYDLTKDMAKRNGIPVLVCDEWGPRTQGWMEAFTAGEVRCTWLIEAYRPASQSIDDYRASIRQRLDAHAYDYAVIPPYYQQQAGGSEAASIDTVNVLREEIAKTPRPPVLIDLFGLRRLPRSEAREQDAAAWIAACPTPPTLRRPVTVPEPPPVVIVVPPAEPDRPVSKWVKFLLALKLLGQAIKQIGKK